MNGKILAAMPSKTFLKPFTLALLLLISAVPASSLSPSVVIAQSEKNPSIREENGWKIISTDIITVKFPANGTHPIFIWWYNRDNGTVYVAHYIGLVEFFSPLAKIYYNGKAWLKEELVEELLEQNLEEIHERLERRIEIIHEANEITDKMGRTILQIIANASVGKDVKGKAEELKELALELKELAIQSNATKAVEKIDEVISIAERISSGNVTRGDIAKLIQDVSSLHKEIVQEMLRIARMIGDELKKVRIRSVEIMQLIGSYMKRLHSAFLPFGATRWNLSDISPIKDGSGKEIGLTFTFNLAKSQIPMFKFAENNVKLVNRFYYVTVNETVGDVTYTVTNAELKTDFIINKWLWNIDIFRTMINAVNDKYNLSLQVPSPERTGLALWVNLASCNRTRLKQSVESVAESLEEMQEPLQSSPRMIIKAKGLERRLNLEISRSEEENMELPSIKGLLSLKFAKENTTLGGYFNFVDVASSIYPNGTKASVPVKAAYRESGSHLKLYMVYPYFDNATLVHDPSIGLEVREITEKPSYLVTVNTNLQGTEISNVGEATSTAPAMYLLTTLLPLIMGGVALTAIALTAILMIKRKR